MPTLTIALTDIPEFSAHFGVSLRITPAYPDGAWLPEAHQTPEQARLLEEYLASGKSAWWAAGVSGTGVVAETVNSRKPLAHMRVMAERIRDALAGACEIIEIAGSIRREKPDVKDVEIVAVGRGAELLALTDSLLADGVIAHRLDKNGRKSYGQKYRRLLWQGTPLDLFMCSLPEFGYTYHLRTGDSAWSHAFVVPIGTFGFIRETGERVPGLLPADVMLKNNRLYRNGPITTETEAQLYAAYGLPVVPPAERNLDMVRRLARK